MTTEDFRSADGASDSAYPGALALNVDKYRKYVDHLELTEEKKIELLQTLWEIMTAFVKHGFGADWVQRGIPALAEISSEPESDEIELSATAENFNIAAEEEKDPDDD